LLTDETKKLFGVEMAEVIERPMQRRWERTAQVYRAAHDGIPASAMLLLSAEEVNELKSGQAVKVKVGNAPKLDGTLVRLDTHAQTVLGQVEALVEFTDPQQRCPAGAFVTVMFTNDNAKAVFAVPESALLTVADGSYVYTANGDHLTRTRVKPGTTSEGFVAIEEGLYAGDSIVTNGTENLWLVELSALKGGSPCCHVPKKNAEK
jgi:multidrug efflux pump subunit AcrA (membrane-fusion protein)